MKRCPNSFHHQFIHTSIMALSTTRLWRSSIGHWNMMNWQLRRSLVSSTRPNNTSNSNSNSGGGGGGGGGGGKLKSRADLFPIYILLGFTGGAVLLAINNGRLQLIHHPGVQVNKANRSMIPEVDSPDSSLASSDKFMTTSFLRKVSHIQKADDTMPMDRLTPDLYKSRRSEDHTTLKTVGVEPRR